MVFNAETENHAPRTRPFFGGWRNKKTGVIYFNAYTQTGENTENKKETAVQTFALIHECTNTKCDQSVQVEFFPDVRDRFMTPGKFSSQDSSTNEKRKEIVESVVKIQRFFRSHRSKATTIHPPNDQADTKDTDKQQVPMALPPPYRSSDFVILNRTSPRTRTDFELLYNLLDRWRILETENASRLLFEPSRIALCSLILTKEIQLLRAIDTMKTTVKSKRRERAYRRFLDELSKPLLWKDSSGEPILVDTPRVQLARDFKDTYDELSTVNSTPERLILLHRLRENIVMHTCKYSYDVSNLIDQEIDLLNRNVDGEKLKWLRNRLKMSFLRLARNSLKEDIERNACLWDGSETSFNEICQSCGRLLPIEKFPCGKYQTLASCNYCLYLKVRKEPRIVYQPYERLLRDLRRYESRLRCCTSLAFVIDSKIVYHLVNDIWHGRSAISESDNFEEFKLTRFYKDAEWSPWNCLLLTRKEARVHGKIDDLEGFYGSMLLQKFRTKNLQAKVYFQSVSEINWNSSQKCE